MRTEVGFWGLAGAVLAAALSATAVGANCALRNPDRQIYEIFPDATSYRTMEAVIDTDLKRHIEEKLGSDLSISDVGKHTAYLVLKDKVPIGIVHARTEAGPRGSIELVWAMDLDMSIRDFRVQRSHDKHADVIKSDGFRQKLVGLDLPGIHNLLTIGNDDIDLAALQIPARARSIAHTVILCGVKTRIITELAFQDSIMPARRRGLVHRYFPQTARVTEIDKPFEAPTAVDVARAIGHTPDQLDRESFTVVGGLGPDDRLLGVLAFAVWSAHRARPESWWAVSPQGIIREVLIVGDVEESVREQFSALRGKDLRGLAEQLERPGGTPAACAVEVLAVLATHGIGGYAPPVPGK